MPDSHCMGSGLCSTLREHWPVEQICETLQLVPHPEGGWYRETHRGGLQVQRADGGRRSAFTRILYLLPEGGHSRWHRVLGAEEVWRFLLGAPLELWMLAPDGGDPTITMLASEGSGTNPANALCTDLHVVPADWWQAARAGSGWSLVSCWVAPGFDFDDFELLAHRPAGSRPPGARADLL